MYSEFSSTERRKNMKAELLKNAIKNRGMTITAVAKMLEITRETFYNRMENGDFRASEIVGICNVLNLSKRERDDIFFTK